MHQLYENQAIEDLVGAVKRDSSSPHYTEVTFGRKMRYARAGESRLKPQNQDFAKSKLMRLELAEAQSRAGLTDSQTHVIELRLVGMTFAEIGSVRGHTKQGALNIYARAVRKLRDALDASAIKGIQDVYDAETHRRGKPSSRHRGGPNDIH
jgi:hypothetical protein